MTRLSIITRTRNQIIQMVIWTVLCIISLMISLSFWTFFDWSAVSTLLQWEKIESEFTVEFISAIVFLLIFCTGLSLIAGITLAIYFRQFQKKYRTIILNILMYLAYLPSLLLGFLILPSIIYIVPNVIFYKLAVGVLMFFLAIFPFVLYQLFYNINNIQQELIGVGYSLGANHRQIANGIILPKIKRTLLITIVLAVGRIVLELVVVGIATGIIQIHVASYGLIIVLLIVISLILFTINHLVR